MSYDKTGIILTDDIAKCVEAETRDHSKSNYGTHTGPGESRLLNFKQFEEQTYPILLRA